MGDAEEVGAGREEDAGLSPAPGQPGLAVGAQESHQAAEHLEPLPLVPGRHPRVQLAAWTGALGLSGGVLGEHPGDAQEPLRMVPGGEFLALLQGGSKLLPEALDGEARRGRELKGDGLGEVAVGVEEVVGAPTREGGADLVRGRPEAGPEAGLADQAGGDGIGEEVGGLVEDVLRGGEGDGAEAAGGPEGLPAAEGGIEGAGDEGIEELVEGGEVAEGVGEEEVEVVGEDAEGVEPDGEAARSEGEEEEEELVGEAGGAQEEEAPWKSTHR
jgi:hypothetical protein